ncbi:hypothetical protein BS78_07G122800 [Paspalum vaginatum]|nr:hypothetical protein BS78_07G122800 [Paspalum vaginatum]
MLKPKPKGISTSSVPAEGRGSTSPYESQQSANDQQPFSYAGKGLSSSAHKTGTPIEPNQQKPYKYNEQGSTPTGGKKAPKAKGQSSTFR